MEDLLLTDRRRFLWRDMTKNIDNFYRFDADGRKRIICGIDEVGRGPLYGDVVAAAVVLPDSFDISEINDSKKLSEKKRIALAERIRAESFFGIGRATAREIDDINILQATKLAMKRALANLGVIPDILLIDAVKLDDTGIESVSIIKGDEKSASIAAASIVAKVFRDGEMCALAAEYPGYGFEKHKGYGTKMHLAAIDACGVLPDHRITFLKKHFEKKRRD